LGKLPDLDFYTLAPFPGYSELAARGIVFSHLVVALDDYARLTVV